MRHGAAAVKPRPSLRRRVATAAAVALVFATSFLLLWSYAAERPVLTLLRPGHSLPAPDVDVSCFIGEGDDPPDGGLDDLVNLRPAENSIFFLETSCGLEDGGGLRLTSRQACAVESAARMHPRRPVFLLVTAAAGRNASSWAAPARQLLRYPNVRVARLRLSRYVRGTPLAEWWDGGAVLADSLWPHIHASDTMRLLTLWRFGGLYLDLDFVVLRSLNGLRNFAGAESSEDVASAALSFGRDAAGRHMAGACLRELRDNFRPDAWSHNGPGVITRVLNEMCETKQVSEMTSEQCGGFRVLPPEAFYPIPWRQWRRYFEEEDANRTMEALSGSFAAHVWNKKSHAENVTLDSRQPYAQLARSYCPRVAAAAGTFF